MDDTTFHITLTEKELVTVARLIESMNNLGTLYGEDDYGNTADVSETLDRVHNKLCRVYNSRDITSE